MIKAFSAGYLKYHHEHSKKKNTYCIIEMNINKLNIIPLIVIDKEGLVKACSIESITEIKGYHQYKTIDGESFGAGELKPLNTKDSKGMLEGLSAQLGFDYQKMTVAFAKGLLSLGLF